jgi:hypothetical protein
MQSNSLQGCSSSKSIRSQAQAAAKPVAASPSRAEPVAVKPKPRPSRVRGGGPWATHAPLPQPTRTLSVHSSPGCAFFSNSTERPSICWGCDLLADVRQRQDVVLTSRCTPFFPVQTTSTSALPCRHESILNPILAGSAPPWRPPSYRSSKKSISRKLIFPKVKLRRGLHDRLKSPSLPVAASCCAKT